MKGKKIHTLLYKPLGHGTSNAAWKAKILHEYLSCQSPEPVQSFPSPSDKSFNQNAALVVSVTYIK